MNRPRPLRFRTFPIIFAAPSGAGKTTVAQKLKEERDDILFSVSCTTRPPRPGEQDGVDYHFVAPAAFEKLVERGEMLEWAEVHGNRYGTPRRNLDAARERGSYLLLDIDVQGARQVREAEPDALLIFLLPPSGRALAERLAGRGSETADARQRRLRNALEEIRAAPEFDYVVVNEDLAATVAVINGIIAAEGFRSSRIVDLAPAAEALCREVRRYADAPEPSTLEQEPI